jgi:hypothetical protein
MARLLATAGDSALRPAEKAPPSAAPEIASPANNARPVEPAPPPAAVTFERPILEAGPDPEPEEDQPATLEALAARFGNRGAKTQKPATGQGKSDRSRQEREKQAAILARLRGQA